jgi:hypothetical protein
MMLHHIEDLRELVEPQWDVLMAQAVDRINVERGPLPGGDRPTPRGRS